MPGVRGWPDAALGGAPRGARRTGGRAEVFAPGAVVWPADGVAVRTEHRGAEHGRGVPVREADGSIRLSVPATPPLFAAVQGGRRFASIEFHALTEVRTAGGVREIQRALVDGVALVDSPEYVQTRAEVRERAPWVAL